MSAGDWRARLGPLYPLAVALQFFTRIPMPRALNPGRADLARATAWVPVVGVLVGGAMALFGAALTAASVPLGLRAVLVVAFGVLLTGAFHEDGLADSCDGLVGGLSRQDKLRIMHDSRIGSYGTVGLILAFSWRIAALIAIPPSLWPSALIVAHVLGRASSVPLILWLPYAQVEGKSKPMLEGIEPGPLKASLLITALLVPIVSFSAGPALLLGALIVAWAGRGLQRTLGGITGDTLGAVNLLVELGTLLIFASVRG